MPNSPDFPPLPPSAPNLSGHRVRSGIAADAIDQDALRVISRLTREGYEAYLVGGCVRDLLLGRRPKDFDVATEARPRQVKRLFRNGRIIGRRFRLVHIVYSQHVIETATFRREPEPREDEDDLLIVDDNEYGNAEEDARRRDFTINALFYDPLRQRIHDYVGGLEDLHSGVLRTIGDPEVRMAEDPVRVMRAIKFATRLGFRIDESTWHAMCLQASELDRSAAPRVMEETFRLLRSGTSLGAFRMLRACGALNAILPSVGRFLGTRDDPDPGAHDRADGFWRLLEALDAYVHDGHEPSDELCLAVLFQRIVEHESDPDTRELPGVPGDARDVFDELALAVAGPARISRRITARARRMIADQARFVPPQPASFQPVLFMRQEAFEQSLALFRLRCAAWGQGWDLYEGWRERYEDALDLPEEEVQRLRKKRRRRRRRRRPSS